MRQLHYTLLALLLLAAACKQSGKKQEAGSAESAVVRTEQHINIPSTRIFIVPPQGFTLSSAFVGLERGKDGAIQMYDMVGGDYYANSRNFSRESFEGRGAVVYDYKEMKVQGFPARYVEMQSGPTSNAISMMFGDGSFSAMVVAVYPNNDSLLASSIKASLRSIVYDTTLKVDPFATASFTIDDSKSRFKFARAASGIFMYTIDGVQKEEYEHEPFLTVTTIPRDSLTNAEVVAAMFIEKMEKYGLEGKELRNVSREPLNGQNAFELDVYGKLKGTRRLIYQLVVTGSNKAIVIQGMTDRDYQQAAQEFRQIARTVRVR